MSEQTFTLLQEAMMDALGFASLYGQTDGAHHKAWVIDQMVRCLTGDDYESWVAGWCYGEDGPDTYSWDEGVAP